ncbi:MAG: hypothetical protein JWO80_804 [Bryobacterales bacterium]|nr:hypothetical protein [Bryobacterales bacterium]
MREEASDTSEASLRKWLRESGIPVEQPFAGVEVKTLDELEHSLAEMARVYQENPETRKLCRASVIRAKDRARFAAKNARAAPGKRALKEEMVQWMLVWLGDPTMFGNWVTLRKAALPDSPLT